MPHLSSRSVWRRDANILFSLKQEFFLTAVPSHVQCFPQHGHGELVRKREREPLIRNGIGGSRKVSKRNILCAATCPNFYQKRPGAPSKPQLLASVMLTTVGEFVPRYRLVTRAWTLSHRYDFLDRVRVWIPASHMQSFAARTPPGPLQPSAVSQDADLVTRHHTHLVGTGATVATTPHGDDEARPLL
jgi:hypothetical protein